MKVKLLICCCNIRNGVLKQIYPLNLQDQQFSASSRLIWSTGVAFCFYINCWCDQHLIGSLAADEKSNQMCPLKCFDTSWSSWLESLALLILQVLTNIFHIHNNVALPFCFSSSSTWADSSVGLGIPSDVSAFSITWVIPWPKQTEDISTYSRSFNSNRLKKAKARLRLNNKWLGVVLFFRGANCVLVKTEWCVGYSPTVVTVAVAVDKMDLPQLPQ